MFIKRKFFTIVASLFLLVTLFGCVRGFYKYTPDNTYRKSQIKKGVHYQWKMMENNNHIVIHVGGEMHKIYSINYNDANDSISALTKPFDGAALDYYYKIIEKKGNVAHRKHRESKRSDIQQVHLFIGGYEKLNDSRVAFSKEDIFQVDVSQSAVFLNALATTGIVSGSIVAGVVGFAFIVCGCPHVYVDNGSEMIYNNTLFTGAKAMQLERCDYKEIPDFNPDDDSFSFQILNEEIEDQYTNMVELISIIHAPDVEVIADKTGGFHTISDLIAPFSAVENNGISVLEYLNERDDYTYDFDPDSINGLAEINLHFKDLIEGRDGKLLIKAKNTLWSGYVYDEFNSLFGKNHAKWAEMNKDKSKEEREKWMREQGIKLLVDIKVDGEWKLFDEVELVGEASLNQIIIPIPSEVVKKDMQFRLRTGYKFWELDYVGLDFSANSDFDVSFHKPSVALGNNGEDFVNELSYDDDQYMKHEFKTELNKTQVVFENLPVQPKLRRTFILKSKGYYVPKSNYEGRTEKKQLKSFVNPGELSRFSQSLYNDLMQKMAAK